MSRSRTSISIRRIGKLDHRCRSRNAFLTSLFLFQVLSWSWNIRDSVNDLHMSNLRPVLRHLRQASRRLRRRLLQQRVRSTISHDVSSRSYRSTVLAPFDRSLCSAQFVQGCLEHLPFNERSDGDHRGAHDRRCSGSESSLRAVEEPSG